MKATNGNVQTKRLSFEGNLHQSVAEVEVAPNSLDPALGIVSKPDLGNLMRAEMHRKHAILQGGPQGHRITSKGLAHAEVPILKRDLSLVLHFTHHIAGAILDRRQDRRKSPRADLIATGRHRHVQRLMRPLAVVDLTPLIEPRLHLAEVTQHQSCQHLRFQGAVKPFLLAMRLGMVRPPMPHSHSQPQQPNCQRHCDVRSTVRRPGPYCSRQRRRASRWLGALLHSSSSGPNRTLGHSTNRLCTVRHPDLTLPVADRVRGGRVCGGDTARLLRSAELATLPGQPPRGCQERGARLSSGRDREA